MERIQWQFVSSDSPSEITLQPTKQIGLCKYRTKDVARVSKVRHTLSPPQSNYPSSRRPAPEPARRKNPRLSFITRTSRATPWQLFAMVDQRELFPHQILTGHSLMIRRVIHSALTGLTAHPKGLPTHRQKGFPNLPKGYLLTTKKDHPFAPKKDYPRNPYKATHSIHTRVKHYFWDEYSPPVIR